MLILVIGLLALIYFNFFNKPTPEPDTKPNTPIEEPEVKITLNDIVDKFNSHSNLQNLKDLGYNCEAIAENNKIIVNVIELATENSEETNAKQYVFTLENRNIKFLDNTNDAIYSKLFLTIVDSIGMVHGLEENEVMSLLNSVDLTITSIDGITSIQTANGTEITVNIDTKIDTSSLKTIYIETNDLKKQSSFIKDSGTAIIEKGNLKLYKQGDTKTSTIIIAEKDNLSSLTYNSILSIIEFLYPNELEMFKTNYPSITTISFDRYIITENPILSGEFQTYFEQYKNDYKFIEIKINKSI